jgi:hypothetical protein
METFQHKYLDTFSLGIFGKRQSGKSHVLKHIILTKYRQFDYIILISSTKHTKQYDYIKKLPIRYSLSSSYNAGNKIIEIMKGQKQLCENNIKPPNILLIFDDCQGLIFDTRPFQVLSASGRHYNIAQIHIYQSIAKMPDNARGNLTHGILFRMYDENHLRKVKEIFLAEFSSITKVRNYFAGIFYQKYIFILIDRTTDEKYILKCDY